MIAEGRKGKMVEEDGETENNVNGKHQGMDENII